MPFDKFKEKYKLLDAGVNIKKLFHDNYIENLTNEGYGKMLKAIEEFLAENLSEDLPFKSNV